MRLIWHVYCDAQADVLKTPAGKQQRPLLQTATSMEEPETPSGHEKPVSCQSWTFSPCEQLYWHL
jgi:hypothetical protein